MFLFDRNLNDAIEVAGLVSSDKLFHARFLTERKSYKTVIKVVIKICNPHLHLYPRCPLVEIFPGMLA